MAWNWKISGVKQAVWTAGYRNGLGSGVDPEGEDRERGAKSLLKEIMAENFPSLGEIWAFKVVKFKGLQKVQL